jgi:hypothetical protein
MYVNPIDILGLSNATDTTSIDSEIVKKAKRKLFADIDLSDNGVLEYYGLQLTKGNCEKAIDELTNNDFKEFYLYLANNKPLNEFLASGKEAIFKNFKQDSIYKLPEFIKFISSYFAPKFDKALLAAFENDNADLTKAILNTSTLIAQTDLNLAFKSVSNNIQNKIAEIDEITKDIKNEESAYDEDDIEDVVQIVKEHFPTNTLNCLPQYFQSQILKIAKSINYLQLSIWDAFDNSQVPNDLLEYLLTLNIGGLERPTFEDNYRIVKKKNDERIEQAKNAPLLKKWALILINLRNINSKIEKNELTPKAAFNTISAVSIEELNELPSFASEIRYSIAYVLRGISISMWNVHKDIETAIKTITKAVSINVPNTDATKLNADLLKLKELKKEKNEIGEPIKSAPNLSTTNGIGTTIYGKTLYFVLFNIPILPLTRYNCESTYNGYRFYGKLKLQIWQKVWKWGLIGSLLLWIIISIVDSNKTSSNYYPTSTESYTSPTTSNENSDNTSNNASEEIAPITSQYIGNQLKDGASPLTGCFGKGIYSGNATLTIKNGGNSDAIICLYSIDNDRTIRNEYVQKNSSFTMSNIAQGEYKIRVFYGNDWNPELENSCGTKGNFESDINFSEFDGTEYFEDSDRGYTNATITLYTVAGGNASSSSIDQSKFFSK